MNSILNSVKKMLGIEADYDHFDSELIILINSVFGILFQLGVGPTDYPFVITDSETEWDEFMPDEMVEPVKSYMFMKVKLLFDPPSNSSVLSSYKELISEFEWRCHVLAETP